MDQGIDAFADLQVPSQGENVSNDHLEPSRDQPKDIEETGTAYRPGGFHPVYIGDIFNERYEVLNKIGYGVYSTVWLVKDLRNEGGIETRFRALKVLSSECYGHGHDTFEKEILIALREGDHNELGFNHVCHLLDDFRHQGPNGTHVCLVFELMGETLRTFGCGFPDYSIPKFNMRRFTIQLIAAVEFAHDCQVIHTDIKPDNIFMKIKDHSLIESGYLVETPIPKQNREEQQYTVIPSRPLRGFYFSNVDQFLELDVVLGDWGVASWYTKHLTENITPVALRSPEVLIRAPWDYMTDWWNLGAVLHEVFRAIRFFSGRVPPDGHYELRQHLTEMVELFGPFPKELLERGDKEIVAEMFDEEGRIKDAKPLGFVDLSSEEMSPGTDIDQQARELYASFLCLLMKVNPSERPSATDMLRHPWLGALPPKE